MKKLIAILFTLVLVSTACGLGASSQTPIVVVVTATSQPVIATPIPANTPTKIPSPTQAPPPTLASTPTQVPSPTPVPVTVSQFEDALIKNGYNRQPYGGDSGNTADVTLRPGITGYMYTKENVYEPIIVYADGYVRLEVLDDKKATTRADHMELKLKVLDKIFPADFMTELRKANDAYNQAANWYVTGKPAQSWQFTDFWKTQEGQYNVSNTTIGSTPVAFSLWFWQIDCPDGYFCWMNNFAGQEFEGQTSFIFYNIELNIAP